MDETNSFLEKVTDSEFTKAIVIGIAGITAAYFARGWVGTGYDKAFRNKSEDTPES